MDFIQSNLLTLILFSPTAAALITLLIPKERIRAIRWFATLASLVPLGLSIWMWIGYNIIPWYLSFYASWKNTTLPVIWSWYDEFFKDQVAGMRRILDHD